MAQIPKAYNKMILMLVTLIVSIASTHAQNKTSSPYSNQNLPEAKPMDENRLKEIQTDFKGIKYKLVLAGYKKYVLPEQYEKQRSLFYNFQMKSDDVFIVNFLGAGTQWISEVIWLLYNNFDFKTAKSKPVLERVPYLEEDMVNNKEVKQLPADTLPSPRLLRTHIPLNLILSISQAAKKIIYVGRNPKDILVATFNFFKSNQSYNFGGDIDKYWSYFEQNEVLFTPYWHHIKEGFFRRNNQRTLFLYIEEDPLELIKKTSSFLNKTITDQQLKDLTTHMNTMNVSKGTWKNVLSKELNEKMNAWIKTNLANSGMEFPSIDIYS